MNADWLGEIPVAVGRDRGYLVRRKHSIYNDGLAVRCSMAVAVVTRRAVVANPAGARIQVQNLNVLGPVLATSVDHHAVSNNTGAVGKPHAVPGLRVPGWKRYCLFVLKFQQPQQCFVTSIRVRCSLTQNQPVGDR